MQESGQHHFEEDFQKQEKCCIGIGAEWQVSLQDLERIPAFVKKREELATLSDGDSYYPYLIRFFLQKQYHPERMEDYHRLAEALKGKDYFLVSLSYDDLILESELDKDRVVTPCGGYHLLQCTQEGHDDLYQVPESFDRLFSMWVSDQAAMTDLKLPSCRACGLPLTFNQAGTAHYLETEYLPMWEQYRKWLQGTMNHSLMILELGVGMEYPSVFRWPMEKVCFYNRKAVFYRVHETLAQIPENIADKSYSIHENSVKWMNEQLK